MLTPRLEGNAMTTHTDPHPTWTLMLFALAGAVLGLALGSGLYLIVNPILERASGGVQELQGLLWNVVPGLMAVGAVVGWRTGNRR